MNIGTALYSGVKREAISKGKRALVCLDYNLRIVIKVKEPRTNKPLI
jgi:hypothetical protein